MIAAAFAAVEAKIAAACAKAGRARSSVQLVAVSKLQPVDAIRAAHALGHRAFGENYAQELRGKHAELAALEGLRWHAIGPVQPKNAKYVAKAAAVFHALDRLETAQELSKRRGGAPPLRVLLEVNVGKEDSKAGLAPGDVAAFAAQVRGLPNLQLVGLTCLPPFTENPEDSRPHFRALKALAADLGLAELSMGTTQDYPVAIEEGATLIRVGTALFGVRSPAA